MFTNSNKNYRIYSTIFSLTNHEENNMTKVQKKQMEARKEIVKKVLPLLEKTPFNEIAVSDICEAAGISTGTFYHYFESKTDILVSLFSKIDEYMEEHAFPLMNHRDEVENLRIFANYWLRYIEETGIEHSYVIATINITDSTLEGEERSTFTKLIQHIEKGQKAGVFDDSISSRQAAIYFMIALRGLSQDWTRRHGIFTLTEFGKDYIEYMLKAMKK